MASSPPSSSSPPSPPQDERYRSCYIRVSHGPADDATQGPTDDTTASSSGRVAAPKSDFFQPLENGIIQLQRPRTNLTRLYRSDGVYSSTFDNEFYEQTLSPQVTESVASGHDLLIWTFGTRQTGKSTVVFGSDSGPVAGSSSENQTDGIVWDVAFDVAASALSSSRPGGTFDVADQLLFSSPSSSAPGGSGGDAQEHAQERFVVSVSFLCVTGDETDQLFDCLSNSEEMGNSRNTRIREDRDGRFYVEGLDDVVVQSFREAMAVLEKGRSFIQKMEEEEEGKRRLHSLVTFAIHRTLAGGDSVTSYIQIMDLCGAERETTAPTAATKQRQSFTSNMSRRINAVNVVRRKGYTKKKEDRTLKAVTRIIDNLADRTSHIPYRDSKMTRLVSRGMGGPSRNMAIVCVSAQSGMFDETCAMLEFMQRIKKIPQSPPVTQRLNRQKDKDEAYRQVVRLSKQVGLNTEGLYSTDIKLDMDSPMEMVELREALSNVEVLEVDPVDVKLQKSEKWWSEGGLSVVESIRTVRSLLDHDHDLL